VTRRLPKLLLAGVLVGAAVAGLLLARDPAAAWQAVRGELAGWRAFADENPLPAAAVFVGVYVGATALSLPLATWMSLIGGAVFGRWLGTALSVPSAATGATLAMLSGRYVLREWVRARFGPRLRAIVAGVERDGAVYLLTLRLIPPVPYFLVNLGMGLTALPARTFWAVSLVGMFPTGFVFVNLGTTAADIETPRGLLSWDAVAALSLLGVLPLVGLVVRRSAARRG
jgi:uncharacterized membrane protein YdjX (TVP38/TMEM64 family)